MRLWVIAILLLTIPLVTGTAHQEPNIDDPDTWTPEYVRQYQVAAFALNPFKAVALDPTILEQTAFAEEYFTQFPLQIAIPQYRSYAKQYLLGAAGKDAVREQVIAEAYLTSLGEGEFAGAGGADNRKIANRYFASSPVAVNGHKELFTDFLSATGVTIVAMEGDIVRYTEAGGLFGNGNEINVQRFKEVYNFHITSEGRIRLIPKDGGIADGHDFTGTILAETKTVQGRDGKELELITMRMTHGTIDGQPIEDGTGLILRKGGIIYGRARRIGVVTFAEPTLFRYTTKEHALSAVGSVEKPAKIIRIDNLPDAPLVVLSGERIDLSALGNAAAPGALFRVAEGHQFQSDNGMLIRGKSGGVTVAVNTGVPAVLQGGTVLVSAGPDGYTTAETHGAGFELVLPHNAFDLDMGNDQYLGLPEDKTYDLGDRDPRIKILQSFLQYQGLYDCAAGCELDGIYGPNTQAAVAEYQRRHNTALEYRRAEGLVTDAKPLLVDGRWGEHTRGAALGEVQFTVIPTSPTSTSRFAQGPEALNLDADDVRIVFTNHDPTVPLPNPEQREEFVIQGGMVAVASGAPPPVVPTPVVIRAAPPSTATSAPTAASPDLANLPEKQKKRVVFVQRDGTRLRYHNLAEQDFSYPGLSDAEAELTTYMYRYLLDQGPKGPRSCSTAVATAINGLCSFTSESRETITDFPADRNLVRNFFAQQLTMADRIAARSTQQRGVWQQVPPKALQSGDIVEISWGKKAKVTHSGLVLFVQNDQTPYIMHQFSDTPWFYSVAPISYIADGGASIPHVEGTDKGTVRRAWRYESKSSDPLLTLTRAMETPLPDTAGQ